MKYLAEHKKLLPEYIVAENVAHPAGDPHAERRVRYHEEVVWHFPNNYGASLAFNQATHWMPELAVTQIVNGECDLVYTTDITSEVVPDVSVSQLAILLARIRGLADAS